jgi:hypothetical protein
MTTRRSSPTLRTTSSSWLLIALAACATPAPAPWQPLFDGRSLAGWQITDFGGQGEVSVRDGRLCLDQGSPLTGVTLTGPPPSGDYEVELVGRRDLGRDFFCALTFPVGEQFATLVLGGWGGSLCGLSCLDGRDASRNETRSFRHFATGTDYRIRLMVAAGMVRAFVGDDCLFAVSIAGREWSLRPEVAASGPFGLASFVTSASFANVRWRPLR